MRNQFKWTLPPQITARLGRESWGAQRAIIESGHLLLILHAPPKADGNAREHEVYYRHVDGKWQHNGADHGERALSKFLDEYRSLLETMDARFEKAKDIEALFAVIEHLIPLARAAGNAKVALQDAREGVGNDAFLIDMRDRCVELARGFELLLADARLALDFRIARSGEAQTRAAEAGNRAQHKLNILAAIAFPLMSLSAVFGMNFRSGLEDLPIIAFWLVFALGLVMGLAVKSWVSASRPSSSPGDQAKKAKR